MSFVSESPTITHWLGGASPGRERCGEEAGVRLAPADVHRHHVLADVISQPELLEVAPGTMPVAPHCVRHDHDSGMPGEAGNRLTSAGEKSNAPSGREAHGVDHCLGGNLTGRPHLRRASLTRTLVC
jgi:hypothetical protein